MGSNLGLYIAVDGVPVAADDHLTWAKSFETMDRVVARDVVTGGLLSTVFLGIDHRFSREGPPLVYETMLFLTDSGYSGDHCERYSTREEALAGHAALLSLITPADDGG